MNRGNLPAGADTQELSHPFDAVAKEYDRTFTDTRLGRWLREAVRARLEDLFSPGDCVLELGCGTGRDAIWLAGLGARVVATDASPAMLDVAWRRATDAGVETCIGFRQLNVRDMDTWEPNLTFDGLLSNFGVLNCVPDYSLLAETVAGWMRPGAQAAVVVMGPLCPWEIGWHLLHGQVWTALRRFRRGGRAQAGPGAPVDVWYPSPRRLRSQFRPFFRHIETRGIGALLPPTYLRHLVEKWPALFERVASWDRRWSGHFPWTWLNDHYLVVLERRGKTG